MVYFVGAGAGDPELLTIKGKRLIDHADVLIYAGSLVNPEVLADRKPEKQPFGYTQAMRRFMVRFGNSWMH